MKKRRIIRDLPLSLTLSEDEDRKLDQLVVMLGADTRSDAVRMIITSLYDTAPDGITVKNSRYPLEESRKRGIAKQLALVAESICDSYCRFPRETASEDELQSICEDCPVNYML
ncbi:MAG: ribbon-helix-helix protein, CopG family [Clostridiales bacterium]|nr:ribbon-helix-helix protein, CopG family [Clostridiales bacterium]